MFGIQKAAEQYMILSVRYHGAISMHAKPVCVYKYYAYHKRARGHEDMY